VSYTGFVVVTVVAFCAPLLLGLFPALRVPGIVLEIAAGIAIGPHGLKLISIGEPIAVFSQVGLALLLFLAGLEIRLSAMRGTVLRQALRGFALTLALAAAAAGLFRLAGIGDTPLLIAITLAATSLSILIVPLKDAGQTQTPFGRLVIAGSTLAEFGSIVLLSFFFSGRHSGPTTELLHLGLFALLALALAGTLGYGRGLTRVATVLDRLSDTTARIRVRADFALVAVAVGLAAELGVEAILAAFTMGVIRGLGEEEEPDANRQDRIEAIAFGIFVPFFFVATGLRFDVGALFESVSSAIELPIFLVALLAVHVPVALVYRRALGVRAALAAGFMQATSLTFVVVAAQLGVQLHAIDTATAAALVGAALLSVVVFPAVGLGLLGRAHARESVPATR